MVWSGLETRVYLPSFFREAPADARLPVTSDPIKPRKAA